MARTKSKQGPVMNLRIQYDVETNEPVFKLYQGGRMVMVCNGLFDGLSKLDILTGNTTLKETYVKEEQ